MNVIRFKLPANFEPKCKAYRSRRRIPRSAHTSPDTLFGLCELVLRRLLSPRVPRRKFWPTVLSVLPGPESSRVRVRHQVEHPGDYNVQQRAATVTSVNYANHWDLLTEALRHEARWPRIRIGESARNRITRLHHATDYPAQQCWQNRPYDMLTSAFIVRTAARIASLEQQRSLVRNRTRTDGRTMTGTSTGTTTVVTTPASSSRRLSRATSVDIPDEREEEEEEEEEEQEQEQEAGRHYYPYHGVPPLMVIGKRATGGSHELRTKPIPPSVRLNQRKKPSR